MGYAAPEQLRGEPVSAATDVYALGILLHVLITGAHPYGSTDSTHTQLARATLSDDAGPPSARLASGAERRRVRGDLDAIVTRALNRDPQARYSTAAELGADIRRFLDNFPVQARPATRTVRHPEIRPASLGWDPERLPGRPGADRRDRRHHAAGTRSAPAARFRAHAAGARRRVHRSQQLRAG